MWKMGSGYRVLLHFITFAKRGKRQALLLKTVQRIAASAAASSTNLIQLSLQTSELVSPFKNKCNTFTRNLKSFNIRLAAVVRRMPTSTSMKHQQQLSCSK
ncbi:hypothetical protein O9993_12315 [Vibrio lentus]|nr:hypothetical protein [Vibrio lentus]